MLGLVAFQLAWANKPDDDGDDESEGGLFSRILPIPIFITEPALGQGLGLALAYFHGQPDEPGTVESASTTAGMGRGREPPPTVTAIAAAYTTNGTNAYGIGHTSSWRDDTLRFKGALAEADVFADIFVGSRAIPFNVEGQTLFSEALFRFGTSDFFLGPKVTWLDGSAGVPFDLPSDLPVEIPPDALTFELTIAALGLYALYDTRDQAVTARSGQYLGLSIDRYDNALGSDFEYWQGSLDLRAYFDLAEQWVLAIQGRVQAVDGEPPFFAYPWISLRGIPALRYQNELAASAQAEMRWFPTPRWMMLGFAGAGLTRGDVPLYQEVTGEAVGGVGFRWKALRNQDAWIGVDLARGPESAYWYVGVGTSF